MCNSAAGYKELVGLRAIGEIYAYILKKKKQENFLAIQRKLFVSGFIN